METERLRLRRFRSDDLDDLSAVFAKPEVWRYPLGRGFTTEGATAALDQAFTTVRLSAVCSVPQSDNVASVRVAERLGMRLSRSVIIPATPKGQRSTRSSSRSRTISGTNGAA